MTCKEKKHNADGILGWLGLAMFLMPLLISCANVSTTRFEYVSGEGSLAIEVPKEIEATDFQVDLDFKKGVAKVRATRWQSHNVETIKAQGARERDNLKGVSKIVEKGIESGVKAGAKAIVPIPSIP